MNGFSANKLAGLSLILGPCLMIAAIILTPGGIVVASARAGEVVAVVRAMEQYPTLAHLSANLGIVGVVLARLGLLVHIAVSAQPQYMRSPDPMGFPDPHSCPGRPRYWQGHDQPGGPHPDRASRNRDSAATALHRGGDHRGGQREASG